MRLYVVGLPLGNIEDISYRAVATLSRVSAVICEDTRMFNLLWQKMTNIKMVDTSMPRLFVLNDFNEKTKYHEVLSAIADFEEVALVSDAGMPLISDPGYKIVNELVANGNQVEVIPGPTALTTSVAISGLPSDKILFVGFLPKKPGKRMETLRSSVEYIKNQSGSLVIYESPFRIDKFFRELSEIDESLRVFVSVDVTKISEKRFGGTAKEMAENFRKTKIKGECTIVVSQ